MLYAKTTKKSVGKEFFTNRSLNIWNNLPDGIVNATTMSTFQNRLDKYWSNQEMLYNPVANYRFRRGVDKVPEEEIQSMQ